MPEYLAPGVYVEEVSSGPPPIAGVGTTTAGMVGLARRGPTSGPPTLVTNYSEFVRAFGGPFDATSIFAGQTDLPYAVKGFFANGGRRLYISRIMPSDAKEASKDLLGGVVTRLRRTARTGDTDFALAMTRGLRVGTKVRFVQIKHGVTTTSEDLSIKKCSWDDDTISVDGSGLTGEFEADCTRVLTDVGGLDDKGVPKALTEPDVAKPGSFGLKAVNKGTWGADLKVSVSYSSAGRAEVKHDQIRGGDTVVPVNSTAGFYAKAWVEVVFGTGAGQRLYRRVKEIAGGSLVLEGEDIDKNAWNPVAPVLKTRITTCEFDLNLSYVDPVEGTRVSEQYSGLTLADIPGRYYVTALASSALARVKTDNGKPDPQPTDDPFSFPAPEDGLADWLAGGHDGTKQASATDYRGSEEANTGLAALERVDEIALLAAPGVTDPGVQQEMIDQATRLKDRFVVLDPPGGTSGADPTTEIKDHANRFDTRYAAIYYPRVIVSDPLRGGTRAVAPSGHVLGMYARVDNTRGVHKAPANEVILGITGLETSVSRGAQESLNPRGINVLRDLRADRQGLRVMGARCLTSEQDWVYVNVRRLFIFIEESLRKGSQWAVFEPNDQRLWARIRTSIAIFLEGVWRDGALMGAKKEEAFFVTCDRSTMTEDDIRNGRLILEIGIAPVFPAEFVILRIGQWLGGSAVQEL